MRQNNNYRFISYICYFSYLLFCSKGRVVGRLLVEEEQQGGSTRRGAEAVSLIKYLVIRHHGLEALQYMDGKRCC